MKNLGLFILCLFLLIITYDSVRSPAYNWDLIGYTACVVSFEESDPQEIFSKTYDTVKRYVPKAFFPELTRNKIPFREGVYLTPDNFLEQLHPHRQKLLYVLILYILHKCGVSIIYAMSIVSVIPILVTCLIVYKWLSKYISKTYVGFLCIPVFISVRLLDLMRLATPDALSTLLIIGALYLLFESKKFSFGITALIINIFIRPDAFILTFLVLVYLLFSGKTYGISNKTLFVWLVVSFLSLAVVKAYSHAPSWWITFSSYFLNEKGGLFSTTINFEMLSYLLVLKFGILRIFIEKSFYSLTPFFVIYGVFVVIYAVYRNLTENHFVHLTFISLLYILIHFLLLPIFIDRYFTFCNLIIYIASIIILIEKGSSYADFD